MRLYRIRRKEDGLFSTGGGNVYFTKQGKLWTNIGHIKSHLRAGMKNGKPMSVYKDCEIVEYELTELQVVDTTDVVQLMFEIELGA